VELVKNSRSITLEIPVQYQGVSTVLTIFSLTGKKIFESGLHSSSQKVTIPLRYLPKGNLIFKLVGRNKTSKKQYCFQCYSTKTVILII
jgi:hypothetical protein